ncbi:MAG TPA: aminopeptidase P family protein [Candidatus Polarisedimenticolia bacterium]|nr:aminopeptidase P family protein [Candidatus Polarisedimenticolia bacterium]
MIDPIAGSRLAGACALLGGAGADHLVVGRLENVRYLSGFTGSAAALRIGGDPPVLCTDSRYAEQATSEAAGFRIEVAPDPPVLAAARLGGAGRVAFEAESITWDLWERMRLAVEGAAGGVLVPSRGLIESLRVRKQPEEIDRLRRAIGIAWDAFEETVPLIRVGAVERDLALEIEFRMKSSGAEELAFDLIVASGPRSALPHGRASSRRIGPGEFVVFDIGARYEGYHSDMTRTVFTGRPGDAQRLLYETVQEAQQAAIEAIGPGVPVADVDAAARNRIAKAGHAGRFGHGTGHGVGLQIHEAPRVGPRSRETLEAGMVITVEPGIYLPGEAGVRIEDIVLVTPQGRETLTPAPRAPWILE